MIVFSLIVLAIAAGLIWGINRLPFDNRPKRGLTALVVVMGLALVARHAGVF